MRRVAIGRDKKALAQWAVGAGADPEEVDIKLFGTFDVADVTDWVGIQAPDPDIQRVNLQAPERIEGDVPGEWLNFRPGEWRVDVPFCTWTEDLMAVILD